MTIAVCCTLADGIILGTDSAITLTGHIETATGPQVGILKVYNDAEKLFTFHSEVRSSERVPVGLVAFGLATLGNRTLQSYMREFELEHEAASLRQMPVKDLVTELHSFFRARYIQTVGAALAAQGKKLETSTGPELPVLGMFVGGFSPDSPLPEAWQVNVHADGLDAIRQIRAPGDFGSNWGGEFGGVQRFHSGFDPGVVDALVTAIASEFKIDVANPTNVERLRHVIPQAIGRFEYQVPFAAMPLQEGIDYTTFLLDMMILQHRFVVGAPTCGGSVRVAVVRKHEGFQWVKAQRLELKGSRYA